VLLLLIADDEKLVSVAKIAETEDDDLDEGEHLDDDFQSEEANQPEEDSSTEE
jgi:hypothetical protein